MAVNFGKYILLDKIATGGMAEIWLAKQTGVEGFEKLVVIKKILPHFTHDNDFVTMFLDEARIAAKLNHPNVVQIYDLGKEQNTYYIAMEFISGDDVKGILQTSIKQGHFLPLQFACNIISQAAEGLHYAHTLTDMYGTPLNIVHRDISPQNILVTYTGTVKIVDFGIAKAATQSQETRAGTLKGKFAYMSPEQALGKKLNGQSDVFALGIVLYEITVGKRLFKSESELKTLKMITDEPITQPIEINPKYPPALNKIVMKALDKDKAKRYQNARELHLDLDDFLKTYPRPSSNVDLSAWMRKTFNDKIEEMKVKHEKLLREEPDQFNVSEMLDNRVETKKSDSQISQISMMGSNPLGFSNNKMNDQFASKSGLYHTGLASSNISGSLISDNDDNTKFKIAVAAVIFLAIIAVVIVFLYKGGGHGCPPGYQGDNCSLCATGYQDNDNDGTCTPGCSLAKTACKKGEICSDQDGVAKCYSLNGNKKCDEGYTGIDCKSCIDGYVKKGTECIKKVEMVDIKDGTILEIPVKSEPSFADIVVNDKLQKDKTNTIIKLQVGEKYIIKVEKTGFITQKKEFTFKGKMSELDFKLQSDKSVQGDCRMIIFKSPSKAVVILDGIKYEDENEQLVLSNLISGEHKLEVTAEGYEPFSQTIKLSRKEPYQKAITLKKASGVYATINTNPSGATVYLNKKKLGRTPIKMFPLPKQKNYKLIITKYGYSPKTVRKTYKEMFTPIDVKLDKKKATVKNKVNNNKKDEVKKDNIIKKDVVKDTGTLTINTVPFTVIYENGKKLGTTPLIKYKLPVGKHRITLVNKKEGISKTIPILISKGRDLPQVIKFRKGTLVINTLKTPVVILNGKTIGNGSLTKKLYEGSYKLKLKDIGLTKTYNITIKPGRKVNINF